MKKFAIIVAGGSGTRIKSRVPKQFLEVNGSPLLFLTIKRFHAFSDSLKIILVLPEKHFPLWKSLCKTHNFNLPHTIVSGGKERFYSVQNALALVPENALVAIHDGVRPFVTKDLIKKCFAAAEKKGNAIPVISLSDSIRQRTPNLTGKTKQPSLNNTHSAAANRNDFFIVQTPQCFRSEIVKNAYHQKYSIDFTDDASVVEKVGTKIHLVEGRKENIKITTLFDLKIAGVIENDFIC